MSDSYKHLGLFYQSKLSMSHMLIRLIFFSFSMFFLSNFYKIVGIEQKDNTQNFISDDVGEKYGSLNWVCISDQTDTVCFGTSFFWKLYFDKCSKYYIKLCILLSELFVVCCVVSKRGRYAFYL